MNPQQPQQTREQFIESLFKIEKKDNIFSDKDTRKKLIAGIKKGVNAIAESYGSAGSNVVIEHDLRPFYEVTNDGKKILDGIKLVDPVENMGLNILKEIADKSDKESGDGRKTSILLAGAILTEGLELNENPMDIKKSLNDCLPYIIDSISKQTRPITPDNIGQVATISSENEELGQLFQEIYSQIGVDGIVEIDNSNLPTTHYEITEGVRLRGAGFTYPYMANSDKGRIAEYKSPNILITKQKINNIGEIDKIMKNSFQDGKELVIFCDEIDVSVSQALAYLHMQGVEKEGALVQVKTLVVKSPTLWKDYIFEDFAKITGATIVDSAQGITFKNFQPRYLGTCEKIITSKDGTIVLGIKDISDHLKVLEENGDEDSKRRICWLQTKTAILKLGANSETELSHLRGKATDARNASYLALQEGIVAGGGISLINASKNLPETIGGDVLRKALKAPTAQICENAGIKVKEEKVFTMDSNTGYDSKTGLVVDMFEAGIVDPSIVVKNAITNALSVVSTILTIKNVIIK